MNPKPDEARVDSLPPAAPSVPPGRSPWPQAIASIGFASTSFVLGVLYSKLHWKVLFVSGRLRESVEEPSFRAAVEVLDSLWVVKAIAAGLALGFAVWGLARCTPRWPNAITVMLATLCMAGATMIE